ncbi:MAG: type VI secretion system tube protein Hcp [Caulobacteraceae bacterium]
MAVDMFLKLDGIKGESKDSVHKGEIEILAWSWGLSNAGSFSTGGGGGSGKVNVQDISFTKYVDLSSPALLLAACSGKHIAEATFIVRKAGEKPLEYITIGLKKALITSISTGGSGGEDRLTENITLNFAQFKHQYKEQSDTGSAGGTPDMGWDVAANAQV